MMRLLLASAVYAAAVALPASAQQVTVAAPHSAASLQEGPLDLVAYYDITDQGAMEVTATFAAPSIHAEPMRVVMALADGERATFALPGYRGSTYSFERSADTLSVSNVPTLRTASID